MFHDIVLLTKDTYDNCCLDDLQSKHEEIIDELEEIYTN